MTIDFPRQHRSENLENPRNLDNSIGKNLLWEILADRLLQNDSRSAKPGASSKSERYLVADSGNEPKEEDIVKGFEEETNYSKAFAMLTKLVKTRIDNDPKTDAVQVAQKTLDQLNPLLEKHKVYFNALPCKKDGTFSLDGPCVGIVGHYKAQNLSEVIQISK